MAPGQGVTTTATDPERKHVGALAGILLSSIRLRTRRTEARSRVSGINFAAGATVSDRRPPRDRTSTSMDPTQIDGAIPAVPAGSLGDVTVTNPTARPGSRQRVGGGLPRRARRTTVLHLSSRARLQRDHGGIGGGNYGVGIRRSGSRWRSSS